MEIETLAALSAFAFAAGLVDAVVGGGGLVQMPALFVLLPGASVPAVLGTNKMASVWGTTAAAATYARRVPIDPVGTAGMALAAAATAWLGAHAVDLISRDAFRPALIVALVVLGGYTLAKKDLGALTREDVPLGRRRAVSAVVGAIVGFYDGFFGPGGGVLFVFGLVTLAGLDFLRASAASKLVNVATNVAALSVFVASGAVLWAAAVPMALCNLTGGVVGSRLALRHGTRFVRAVFIVVVGVLLVRLLWDAATT